MFLLFPLIFLYIRTAHVAHLLESLQYCAVCVLWVMLGWREENTATEGQIGFKSALFCCCC